MEYHITFTCEDSDYLVEFDGYGCEDNKYKFGIEPYYIADFSSLNEAIKFTKQMVKGVEAEYKPSGIEILYARIECDLNILYMKKQDGEMVVDWRNNAHAHPYTRDIGVMVAIQKEYGPHPISKHSKLLKWLKKNNKWYQRSLIADAIREKRKKDRKNASKKGNN